VKTNFRPTTTTPVPPTRVSARIQARADAAAADDAVNDSRLLNEEGLDAEKEGNESAFLLQEKQLHQKTNFQPTTIATTTTRVSTRIQERTTSATAAGDLRLLNEEEIDTAKEASESAFLLQEKQLHKKTNFRPTTTTVAVGSQPKGYSTKSMTASIEESRLSIEGVGVAKEARGSALLVCRAV